VRRARGQAAVETALTMPLLLFMVLGTLQLVMLLQGRILAQYAAGRATRLGAMNFGKCDPIQRSAIAILLPAIDAGFARGGISGAQYALEVKKRSSTNRYSPAEDSGRNGPVVWVDRVRPLVGTINPATEEDLWNLAPPQGPDRTLEVRMTFWFPLKIPFANWIFARLALAHWGVEAYHAANPYLVATKDANWRQDASVVAPPAAISAELLARFHASPPQYVFPIQATSAMRMMSPARYTAQNCPR
jgi:hypothetical protein